MRGNVWTLTIPRCGRNMKGPIKGVSGMNEKAFPMFEDWQTLFRHDRATGEMAKDAPEVPDGTPVQTPGLDDTWNDCYSPRYVSSEPLFPDGIFVDVMGNDPIDNVNPSTPKGNVNPSFTPRGNINPSNPRGDDNPSTLIPNIPVPKRPKKKAKLDALNEMMKGEQETRMVVSLFERRLECYLWKNPIVFMLTRDLSYPPRPDNLDNLRKLAEQFQKQAPSAGAATTQEDDDDDVPELVDGQTFEAAAEDGHTSYEDMAAYFGVENIQHFNQSCWGLGQGVWILLWRG
ncbi:Nascent polypeptide-associated complex NAC [Actinidia rufa]|uniref:Nascent polypeptide-associated complex NAC n=1 Tax=Actinidia rufa TaxID=165716 RepID=A0A7J0FTU1_9ERIC|nr:Nascent polypeptide-associated complex NAC [Actinidia rufa]